MIEPAISHAAGTLVVFAWLALALPALGCVGDANPVIPSTGGGGLSSGGGSNDGGASDTMITAPDVTADSPADLVALGPDDADPVVCDLLTYVNTKQGCASSQACYPVSGSGRCQTTGSYGVLGQCGFGGRDQECDKGLTCVASPDTQSMCLPMCDVHNPGPTCGVGTTCHPLPGFTNVGYCQSV